MVTAGNCCSLNDGAAAVVIMSDTKAGELGLTPLARIVSSTGVSGLSPQIMGLGPVEATKKFGGLDRAEAHDLGGEAATPVETIRASGVRPSSLAFVSDMITTAAAPSLRGQQLPAVTTPSGRKTGSSCEIAS